MRPKRRGSGRFLLVMFALAACATPQPRGGDHGAHELEERLLAPCCWIQTLDMHESELATALRAEIEQRLRQGESAAAIEDDLAARHGERIRAVPRGKDPRSAIPKLVGVGMVVALVALVALLRRWLRRERDDEVAGSGQAPGEKDEYDQRLDDELARLDDA